jgi:prolyl-tRNA editing enzyme YbaK/EbsC (Cys-tRNA(Pro) deacylase)
MGGRGENEVRAFFELAGVPKEIHRFEESTHNSELAARTLGVQVGQIAKTILLLSDETAIVVVISGDRRVDTKKVRALGYGKKVRLAGPDDVVARTGFAVGAVSPVALPDGVPIYIDRSLRRFETHRGDRDRSGPRRGVTPYSMFSGAFSKFRVKLFHALRANAVTEVSDRMPNKIFLDGTPIVLVVSDALAISAYGNRTPQGLKLHQIIHQSFILVAKNLINVNNFKVRLYQTTELHH